MAFRIRKTSVYRTFSCAALLFYSAVMIAYSLVLPVVTTDVVAFRTLLLLFSALVMIVAGLSGLFLTYRGYRLFDLSALLILSAPLHFVCLGAQSNFTEVPLIVSYMAVFMYSMFTLRSINAS